MRTLAYLATALSTLTLVVACGDDSPADSGGGGTGSSSGGRLSEGDVGSGAAAAGGAATGGATSNGGVNSGGDGGMGGGGGDTSMGSGGMMSGGGMALNNHCPGEPSDYTSITGTDGDDVYVDSDDVRFAYIGFSGDESITTDGSSAGIVCLPLGQDNDTAILVGTAGGTEGAPTGTHHAVRFVGGGGANTLDYRVISSGDGLNDYRPPFETKGFVSGADRLRIEFTQSRLGETVGTATVATASGIGSSSDLGHVSCSTYQLALDSVDGAVWLTQTCSSAPQNVLIGTLSAGVHATDIEIYSASP